MGGLVVWFGLVETPFVQWLASFFDFLVGKGSPLMKTDSDSDDWIGVMNSLPQSSVAFNWWLGWVICRFGWVAWIGGYSDLKL